jgi:hypothetical protein
MWRLAGGEFLEGAERSLLSGGERNHGAVLSVRLNDVQRSCMVVSCKWGAEELQRGAEAEGLLPSAP